MKYFNFPCILMRRRTNKYYIYIHIYIYILYILYILYIYIYIFISIYINCLFSNYLISPVKIFLNIPCFENSINKSKIFLNKAWKCFHILIKNIKQVEEGTSSKLPLTSKASFSLIICPRTQYHHLQHFQAPFP